MNSTTTAGIGAAVAAVAACNGRDPHAAQAAMVPAVALDAPAAIAQAAPGDARPADADDGSALSAAPEVEAFHGRLPALPMLSLDGKLVAIEVSEGLGLSSFH